MSPIAIRIRELREQRGWTQAHLSQIAGVTEAALSRIENAQTTGIDFETLEKLADALDVHPAVLIERTPDADDGVPFMHRGKRYTVRDNTGGVASVAEGQLARPSNASWCICRRDENKTVLTFEAEPDDEDRDHLLRRARTELDNRRSN